MIMGGNRRRPCFFSGRGVLKLLHRPRGAFQKGNSEGGPNFRIGVLRDHYWLQVTSSSELAFLAPGPTTARDPVVDLDAKTTFWFGKGVALFSCGPCSSSM